MYKHNETKLGFVEKKTIAEFTFQKEIDSIDDFCKYWSKTDYLLKKGFLNVNYE